jgi:putative transposase
MIFDPKKHHRRSIRLKGYDYAQTGAYFVTLCTWQRDCIFGEVVGGRCRLSALGQIVQDEWLRSMEIRREIRLYEDEFVVMPNHLHGIVWIIEPVGADGVHPMDGRGACHAPPSPNANHPSESTGANLAPPSPNANHPSESTGVSPAPPSPNANHPSESTGANLAQSGSTGANPAPTKSTGACHAPQHVNRPARSLPSFIAGFKASVTSRARRELDMTGVRQRNYYEHIIRNEAELKRIWNYIVTNPDRWQEDQLHPAAPPNSFNRD